MRLVRVISDNFPHFQLLVGLDEAIFEPAWTLPQWRDEVAGSANRVYVAYADDELRVPAGLLTRGAAGDTADLKKIGVAANFRGRGFGSFLLDAAIEGCISEGFQNMMAEVAITNRAALSLYSHAGFHRISRRKAYYGRSLDAWVLQKEL